MSYIDKLLGTLFPTRSGAATGAANERQMLDKTEPESFQSVYRSLPDGAVRLRTKGGMPEFVVETTTEVSYGLRGFMLRGEGEAKATLFDEVLFSVRSSNYIPYQSKYYVGDFQTGINAVARFHDWNDVLCFNVTAFYVNGIPFAGFTVNGDGINSGRIPYLVKHSAEVPFGVAAVNSSAVRRVFSIGAESVRTLTDGTVATSEVVLAPVVPRQERKAIVGGPYIDESTNTVTLRQFYFTGQAWDDLNAGWVFSKTRVSMMLVPPFMTYENAFVGVDCGTVIPALESSNSGTTNGSYTPPPGQFGVIGVAEVGPTHIYNQYTEIEFPWREVLLYSPDGYRNTNYSSSVYSGTLLVEEDGLVVSATNTVDSRSNSDTIGFIDQNVQVGQTIIPGNTEWTLYWDSSASAVRWGLDGTHPYRGAIHGNTYFPTGSASHSGGSYKTIVQDAEFYIEKNSIRLVDIVIGRQYDAPGTTPIFTPITTIYNTALSNPYGWVGAVVGFGVGNHVSFYSNVPIEHGADGDAAITTVAESFVGKKFIDHWEYAHSKYTYTVDTRPGRDDKSLNCTTRDYIIFDELNQVFVYVKGQYEASQTQDGPGEGELTVKLVIETPAGTSNIELYSSTFSHNDILPTEELVPGVDYVPTPKLRTIFVPLYMTLGDFAGAVYTTQGEVANGVSPAYLLNFLITLDTYAGITDEINRDSANVRLIPCNLLEIIHSYIVSTKYGIDEYERYPIQYVSHFQKLLNELFGVKYAVSYRNGVVEAWAQEISGQYGAIQKTELYRT